MLTATPQRIALCVFGKLAQMVTKDLIARLTMHVIENNGNNVGYLLNIQGSESMDAISMCYPLKLCTHTTGACLLAKVHVSNQQHTRNY